ncbi:MAG: cupin domain-containing protein [Salinirussus sp.]
MERTAIAEIDPWMSLSPAAEKRSISKALGTEECAINYYELEPGETFGFGYHRHEKQEELFYLLSGTATFETERGEVSVSAGEVIRRDCQECEQRQPTRVEPTEERDTLIARCEVCGTELVRHS